MPRWRLDDVMVSFATDQGGVGPHLDQYDVFLIQGEGQRRWRVGSKDQVVTNNNPHPDIAQIEAFETTMDVNVEAGDLLYIPPNTPHWGESIGNSICYSVGFRAPNLEALTQRWLEESTGQLNQLWQDQGLLESSSATGVMPDEIEHWARQQLQKQAQSEQLKIAVGKEVTQLKYPELLDEVSLCEAQELSELATRKGFKLKSISRLAFFKHQDSLMVFVNGDYFQAPSTCLPLLEAINQYQTVVPKDFSGDTPKALEIISYLFMADAIELTQ